MAQLLEVGWASGSGLGEIVFSDFGLQDVSQGRYTSWTDFMAKLATIQIGAAPRIVFALLAPYIPPAVGMPVDGWDFRGAIPEAFYPATGTCQVTLAPGVKFNNLFGIGSGLVLNIAPALGDSVLSFTAIPTGGAWIFRDGGYVNNTGAGSLIRSPGTEPGGTTIVYSAVGSQYAVANPPVPVGAKLVFVSNDGGQEADGLVIVQQQTLGGLPTDCFENNNTGSGVIRIWDASGHLDTQNLAVWQPNLSNPPLFSLNNANSVVVAYSPSAPAQWAGSPDDVAEAIDRLASAVFGLLGGPIP